MKCKITIKNNCIEAIEGIKYLINDYYRYMDTPCWGKNSDGNYCIVIDIGSASNEKTFLECLAKQGHIEMKTQLNICDYCGLDNTIVEILLDVFNTDDWDMKLKDFVSQVQTELNNFFEEWKRNLSIDEEEEEGF